MKKAFLIKLVDVNDDILNSLYLSVFNQKNLIVNEKEIKSEKSVLKEGFYGNENNLLGFEIFPGNKINQLRYSFSDKKYNTEFETTYKFVDSLNCFLIKDASGSDVYITTFDKFFYSSKYGTIYELNVKYK